MLFPPAICCVSWLLHGPLWITVSCGVVWALVSLLSVLMAIFALTLLMHRSVPRQYPVPNLSCVFWFLFLFAGTLIALLTGRVDWAFYVNFGVSPLGTLSRIRPLSFSKALHLLLAAALCLAFAKHAVGIVISFLLLEYLRTLFARPTLREALAKRSTRAQHVARIRDLSDGGKRVTESLLQAECETENWEEALKEWKRHRQGQELRQNDLIWAAKIYLGLERYQEVLRLEGKARRAACAIEPYLAMSHAYLGHHEKALSIAEEAVRLKRPGAEMALGEVYFADNQYASALRWYDTAAQNRRERADALRAVGRALIALGDYREAGVAYEQSIRMTKFVRPEDLRQLAQCLHKTGRANAAAEIELLASKKEEPIM